MNFRDSVGVGEIAVRCGDAGMAEAAGDGADVHALDVQTILGVGRAEHVHAYSCFPDAGETGVVLYDRVKVAISETVYAGTFVEIRYKQRRLGCGALAEAQSDVGAYIARRDGPKIHGAAGGSATALFGDVVGHVHVNQFTVVLDVFDAEIADLAGAQAAEPGENEDDSVAQALRGAGFDSADDGLVLFRGENRDELLFDLRLGDVLRKITIRRDQPLTTEEASIASKRDELGEAGLVAVAAAYTWDWIIAPFEVGLDVMMGELVDRPQVIVAFEPGEKLLDLAAIDRDAGCGQAVEDGEVPDEASEVGIDFILFSVHHALRSPAPPLDTSYKH